MTATNPTSEIRTALEAAIAANPADSLAVGALRDWWQDQGVSRLTATRRANAVVRQATVEANHRAAVAAVTADTAAGRQLRAAIRVAAECRVVTVPVEVEQGDAAPQLVGEEGYHTFKDSNRVCHYPGSARMHGYKTEYHRSTRRVTVGENWLVKRKLVRV